MNERNRFDQLKNEHAAATSEHEAVPVPERPGVATAAPGATATKSAGQDFEKLRAEEQAIFDKSPQDRITRETYFNRLRGIDNAEASAIRSADERAKAERMQRALNRTDTSHENDRAPDSREGFGRERHE